MQYAQVEHELMTGEKMSEVDEKAKEMQLENALAAEAETIVSDVDGDAVAAVSTAQPEETIDTEKTPEPAPGQEDDDEPAPQKSVKGIGDLVIVGIFSIILGVLLCLPTFLGSSGSTGTKGSDLSGGVAASFKDVQIGENDITAYIEAFRASQGLDNGQAWGEWLASQGQNPESIRSSVISYFAEREMISKAAAEMGIEVTEDQIDEQLEAVAEQYGGMEAFEEMIVAEGSTMELVRETIGIGLKQQALASKVASEDIEVDDETVLGIMKLYYADTVPEDATTLEGLDPEMVEEVRSMLQESLREQAFNEWFEQYAADADLTINDMPEGLPYDVDMSSYENEGELVELVEDFESVPEDQDEEVEAEVAD